MSNVSLFLFLGYCKTSNKFLVLKFLFKFLKKICKLTLEERQTRNIFKISIFFIFKIS